MDLHRFAPAALLLTLVLDSACGPGHIAPYEARRRAFTPPVAIADRSAASPESGALTPNSWALYLYSDRRPFMPGDLVKVRVLEQADARRGAATDLSRSGGIDGGLAVTGVPGAPSAKADMSSTFTGKGQTARSESVEADVVTTVMEVLPNGNLFVEGHKVVLVNEEEQHLYVSGVIRPEDIDSANTVLSSLMGEAEIEFTGRGVMTDKQRPGWLHRGMDYVSPF